MNNFLKTFFACLLAIIASSILNFIFILISISIFMSAILAEPKLNFPKDGAVLRVDLGTAIVEMRSSNPFMDIDFSNFRINKQQTLLEVTSLIRNAASDDKIKGVWLDIPMNMTNDLSTLSEIRDALTDFRKSSGKPIIAYSDGYTQNGYFLASVADHVYLTPAGSMEWFGMASQSMFLSGTLKKLGVEPEVFRCGKFKGAIEPFLLDKLSPENRLQMEEMLNSVWGYVVGSVAQSRGLDSANLQNMASNLAVTSATKAHELKLIDHLEYRDVAQKNVMAQLGFGDASNSDQMLDLSRYAIMVGPISGPAVLSDNEIAVLYASGDIVDYGDGNDKIVGNTVAQEILKLKDNKYVKAVVLRINSGGGSALASDIMHHAVEELRAVKPVVVSMGSYAASGGYYMSCGADRIVAEPMTITGSIGVFGLSFNAEKGAKEHLGITFDKVSTNPNAGMYGIFGPLNNTQKRYIQNNVDTIYDRFITLVSQGRNLSKSRVDSLAQGRIYSGIDALEIGLVDKLGTLEDAIILASELSSVGTEYRLVQYPKTKISMLNAIMDMGQESIYAISPKLQQKKIEQMIESMQGVRAQMEYSVEIR